MIGRNRFVKPEVFRHPLLRKLQAAFRINFRMCYIGLWTQTDREGRFEWKPQELQEEIDRDQFEGDDFDLILNALANAGFIIKYRVGHRTYGWIPRWTEHQAINAREQASRLPPPPPSAYELYDQIVGTCHLATEMTWEQVSVPPFISTESGVTSPVDDASVTSAPLVTHEGSVQFSSVSSPVEEKQELPSNSARATEPMALTLVKPAAPTNGNGNQHALPAVRGEKKAEAIRARLGEVFRQISEGERSRLSKEQELQLKAEMVFLYWIAKFDHPNARLDEKRSSRIVARLKQNDGDVGELLYALDGAHANDFIMGQGEYSGKQRYDGLETILRDRAQVEKFSTARARFVRGEPHKLIPMLEAAIRGGEADADLGEQIASVAATNT